LILFLGPSRALDDDDDDDDVFVLPLDVVARRTTRARRRETRDVVETARGAALARVADAMHVSMSRARAAQRVASRRARDGGDEGWRRRGRE